MDLHLTFLLTYFNILSKVVWELNLDPPIRGQPTLPSWLQALFIHKARSLFIFLTKIKWIRYLRKYNFKLFFLYLNMCIATDLCCIKLSLWLTLLLQTFMNPIKYFNWGKKRVKVKGFSNSYTLRQLSPQYITNEK